MLVIDQLIVDQPSMFVKKWEMLGRFLRLVPLRFSGVLGDDTYGFLIFCEDRLYMFF